MDERQRANRYVEKMRELEDRTAERDKLEREIEEMQDRLAEMWGEMGEYGRNRVGLMEAER